MFPFDMLPSNGAIDERSPFLSSEFVNYAMRIPLHHRYTAHLRTLYHRRKSLVLQMFPPEMQRFLPERKQMFSKTFARQQLESVPDARRCIELGLIDADEFTKIDQPTLLHAVRAVEQWIIGAEQRGAIIVD